MKIGKPQIVQKDGEIFYKAAVESKDGREVLWYSLNEKYSHLVSSSSDAPLIALLIIAMANNEKIILDGKVSQKLFFNLSRIQKILQLVVPKLHQIQIENNELDCQQRATKGIAAGFSGGIDSFCLLADYFYSEIPSGLKVNTLLFNNVGSHALDMQVAEKLFQKRYIQLLPVANRIGLPFVRVNSNLDFFYKKKYNFQQTHTMRNASVALLLQGGLKQYMYASAYAYSDIFIGPAKDIAYVDSILLPLLSTENIDLSSVGSEYTRVEKTMRVSKIHDSYTMLDVCVKPVYSSTVTNCSTCWKCLRTLATLEILDMLEPYSASFNLDLYKQRRNTYFAELIGSKDPLHMEIVKAAEQRGFQFPLSSRLMHSLGLTHLLKLFGRKKS